MASSGPKTKEQKRAEAEARNRAYRTGKAARSGLAVVEAEIAELQARHDALVELMAQPELYSDQAAFDAALAEYTDVKSRIPGLESEWITLADEVERAARGV